MVMKYCQLGKAQGDLDQHKRRVKYALHEYFLAGSAGDGPLRRQTGEKLEAELDCFIEYLGSIKTLIRK